MPVSLEGPIYVYNNCISKHVGCIASYFLCMCIQIRLYETNSFGVITTKNSGHTIIIWYTSVYFAFYRPDYS